MWDAVFATLRPGVVCDDEALTRAEAALGFPLPESYRSFCRTCGAGLAGGHIRIAVPDQAEGADLVSVAEVIAHGVAAARAEHEIGVFDVAGDDASVVDRACFFGRGEAGELLFWDVVPGRGEYEIWVLAADLESVRFGGADLADLLARLQGPAVRGILGLDAVPLPATFVGDDAAPDGTLLS
ncbi:hypothetical protein ASG40_17780 [Methylobacterium sp. Leaf399]|uniref:SMI1/KNR4 family protein n=1 Tax=Methylobacterium sp. Leaf399 TaxID=1736364 RepID=UPI0006FE9B13|nr:SMI1/KNR4 family protein [Methylobacterium sp. Leaf399]KQT16546.1 hypothetical protein ASG40_17780 [Methylobacterium sp. Leaf399]